MPLLTKQKLLKQRILPSKKAGKTNLATWFSAGSLALQLACPVWAGTQREEQLSASVKALLSRSIADRAAPKLLFKSETEGQQWLFDMSNRLAKKIPDAATRVDFLKTVHYEATRAGLDPQLVLGLIQVESGFRKYAVSSSGARGYMQVMPFWLNLIGEKQQNLFHLRTNLRYGCTILRHYLDIEQGDLFRALGRYNGSLGQAEYPNLVLVSWQKNWHYIALPVAIAARDVSGNSAQN